MENLVWWLMTASISALCVIVWTAFRSLEQKLDALQKVVSDEMREMDVRVARLEAHIWPSRDR